MTNMNNDLTNKTKDKIYLYTNLDRTYIIITYECKFVGIHIILSGNFKCPNR